MQVSKFFDHPAKDIFKAVLGKELKKLLITAILVFTTGLLLVIFFLFSSVWFSGIGVVMMLAGTYLFVVWSQIGVPENTSLYKTIKFTPEEVVWIYSLQMTVMPFGVQLFNRTYLTFKLLSGKEETVQIPKEKELVLENWLKRILPNATFGYSHEKATAYNNDPRQLKKGMHDF
jgi:hypothetical protein